MSVVFVDALACDIPPPPPPQPPSCSEWRGRVNSKNPVCSVTSGPMQSIRLFLISGWLGFQSLFKWAPTKPEAPTSVLSLPVFLPLSFFLLHSFSKY